MIDIYGTIGPSCSDREILKAMFQEGMTGIRLNTSHISLREAEDQIAMIHEAAKDCGIQAKLLIDLQGPELRIGKLVHPIMLGREQLIPFRFQGEDGEGIPVSQAVLQELTEGTEVLLDDGKILLKMREDKKAAVLRGGVLKSSKSIALNGKNLDTPTMTQQDCENLKDACIYGVTGVMQPFVRNAEDLRQVRDFLDRSGGDRIRLLAKIENQRGVENLESFFPLCDEIVIARGDLGNAVPLWELPKVQKDIEKRCLSAGVPFMVVTQMLSSMEHNAVPTRAEVSDIYNAVCDGASSVMVTGETAAGEYPVEVIRYLASTVRTFFTT